MRWIAALAFLFGVAGVSLAVWSLVGLSRLSQRAAERQTNDAARVSAVQRELQESAERNRQAFATVHHRLRADEFPWQPSADGKIAVRMTADADVYIHDSDTIVLLCEVKNVSDKPLHLPVPEIMPYAGTTKLVGSTGELRYLGPAVSRPPPAVVEVKPGRVLRHEFRLSQDTYAGMNTAGEYRMSFRYSPAGSSEVESFVETEIVGSWSRK